MSRLIEFPFATGIDQRTRPEYVDGTQSWIRLENVRCHQTGAADKRPGFDVFDLGTRAGSADRSTGYRMFMDGDAHAVIDGTYVDAFSTVGESVSRSRVPEATFRLKDLPTYGIDGTVEDVAYCGGCIGMVSLSTVAGDYTACATIIDAKTGAVLYGPTQLGATLGGSAAVAIASYGTYLVAVIGNATTTTITTKWINTSTSTTISAGWQAGITVTSAWSNTTPNLSVASFSDRVFIAYQTSSGTNRVSVMAYTVAGGSIDSTTIATASVTPSSVDIDVGALADTLWVTWNQTTSVKVAGLTPTALTVALATTGTIVTATSSFAPPRVCASSSVTGQCRIIVQDFGSFTNSRTASVVISAGVATLSGSAARVPGVYAIGRPFMYGGRYYVLAQAGLGVFTTTTQSVAIVVDFTEQVTYVRPVCNVEPGTAVPSLGYRGKALAHPSDTSKVWLTVNVRRSSIANSSQLAELDFASVERWQPATFNNSVYLSGGVLGYSDGRSFCEAGFLYRPTKPTMSQAGTGLTISQGVRYVVVYESVDADGNLTVSGVSDPSSAITFTNKTNTVTSQPCAITYRADSTTSLNCLRVAFYRTADNGGTPPYYRLATVENDTTSETVIYADTTPDATLIANAKLYTEPGGNGAAQDRRAPPGLLQIAVYNGMLVGASGRNLWYSGQPVIGEAAWFNPIFQIPIDGDGDITALAVMDGSLFVFKRRGIWVLAGDPPADNATSGGLGSPRRLATDVGCVSQRSVVVSALGTFFQSERGLEVLSRAQTVDWIGEYVQDEVALFPYCMSATLDPIENVVYFEMASSVTSGQVSGGATGRAIVFDLSLKKWISFDRRHDYTGTADVAAQSACMLYDAATASWAYGWMDTAGRVYKGSATSYLDPGSLWVTRRAESAYARVALQGIQAVDSAKLIAKHVTDADVSVALGYDYEDSFRTARVWTHTEIAALAYWSGGGAGTMPNIQLQHDGHDDAGECMAARAALEDSTPTGGTVGVGRGALWYGLTFEITPKDGGYKLPDGAR